MFYKMMKRENKIIQAIFFMLSLECFTRAPSIFSFFRIFHSGVRSCRRRMVVSLVWCHMHTSEDQSSIERNIGNSFPKQLKLWDLKTSTCFHSPSSNLEPSFFVRNSETIPYAILCHRLEEKERPRANLINFLRIHIPIPTPLHSIITSYPYPSQTCFIFT